MIDRRTLLAVGGAAALAPTSAWISAASAPPPMGGNKVAGSFKPLPQPLPLPTTTLLSRTGSHRLTELRGRPALIFLWAEWCVPCLLELSDLDALRVRHGREQVGMVAVLTSSERRLDWQGARDLLSKRGVNHLTLLVEPKGGGAVLNAFGDPGRLGHPSLPCSLLVDASGMVRARSNGASMAVDVPVGANGVISDAAKHQMLAASAHTSWASADADRFVEAVGAGWMPSSAALGRPAR